MNKCRPQGTNPYQHEEQQPSRDKPMFGCTARLFDCGTPFLGKMYSFSVPDHACLSFDFFAATTYHFQWRLAPTPSQVGSPPFLSPFRGQQPASAGLQTVGQGGHLQSRRVLAVDEHETRSWFQVCSLFSASLLSSLSPQLSGVAGFVARDMTRGLLHVISPRVRRLALLVLAAGG